MSDPHPADQQIASPFQKFRSFSSEHPNLVALPVLAIWCGYNTWAAGRGAPGSGPFGYAGSIYDTFRRSVASPYLPPQGASISLLESQKRNIRNAAKDEVARRLPYLQTAMQIYSPSPAPFIRPTMANTVTGVRSMFVFSFISEKEITRILSRYGIDRGHPVSREVVELVALRQQAASRLFTSGSLATAMSLIYTPPIPSFTSWMNVLNTTNYFVQYFGQRTNSFLSNVEKLKPDARFLVEREMNNLFASKVKPMSAPMIMFSCLLGYAAVTYYAISSAKDEREKRMIAARLPGSPGNGQNG
ncbi:hypothetical protein [Tropicimonas sp.]|uniref:hypothetical protein n=1 Tax=Tropicimonas sp. TaxID=2067044 RepID=UPI003A8B77C0